eukprot:TRINITY_DN12517_c0_g1_i2.p1 TRINITY_DN12517_c0_g1~~TRINITY_DN12517_c0_g1_i2.p1  ORF type:complete len:617 (+),score=122.90 TRINITY_DN12517_c0_g1_i2:80-1930(+)
MGTRQSGGEAAMDEDQMCHRFEMESLDMRVDEDLEYFRPDALCDFSVLQQCIEVDTKLQQQLRTSFEDPAEDLAIGAFLGLAVGDALGAPLEFTPYGKVHEVELHEMGQEEIWKVEEKDGKRKNKFGCNMLELKPGQWTDDTSMALCLADSLLLNKGLNCFDLRLRFLNWWHFGYNNAFAHDAEWRLHSRCGSVGLGGNIGAGFRDFLENRTELCQAGDKHTSGNGSIMRLAPLAIYYRQSLKDALDMAERQSLATHQGEEAAECCRLLAHILVTALSSKGEASRRKRIAMESSLDRFSSKLYSVTCLARSQPEEPHAGNVFAGLGEYSACLPKVKIIVRAEKSLSSDKVGDFQGGTCMVEEFSESRVRISAPHEGWINATTPKGAPLIHKPGSLANRNWNWKAKTFSYAPGRVDQDPDYVGSYAMDCLAMALHCVWTTEDYRSAVLKAANMRGDADTVAATAGQIAGAIYGAKAVPAEWREQLWRWDQGGVAYRAHLLYHQQHDKVQWRGRKVTSMAQKLRDAFEAWDANKDGWIDKPELEEVFKTLGMGAEETERLFQAADMDSDGRISWSEFCKWLYSSSVPSGMFEAVAEWPLHVEKSCQNFAMSAMPAEDE